jgi:hypothetical protein
MLRHHIRATLLVLTAIVALGISSVASAHPHEAENAHGGEGQVVANGQNHPGFVDQGNGTGMSCEGVNEPPNSGPAGYGLETAHHGPDQGTPGKADGCFVTEFPTQDNSPGLD